MSVLSFLIFRIHHNYHCFLLLLYLLSQNQYLEFQCNIDLIDLIRRSADNGVVVDSRLSPEIQIHFHNPGHIQTRILYAVIAVFRCCKACLRISLTQCIQPGHVITVLVCQQDQFRFPTVLIKRCKQMH